MEGNSLDIKEERRKQLKALFPEIFAEGKIDYRKLRLLLEDGEENKLQAYELNWAGKDEALKDLQKTITSTLIPDKENSIHFATSENLLIEGDNLDVLRTLQRSYYGKVKMIYIDPPYNTGNDYFVYPDNWKQNPREYDIEAGITDKQGKGTREELHRKHSKESRHFHSLWLSMMYPRLYLAKNLLRDDGVIFISIDDNEVANLRLLMNQIFGEENFVGQIIWQKKTGGGAKTKGFIGLHEYILCYVKNFEFAGEIGTVISEKMKKMYSGKDEYYDTLGPFATWPLDTTSMDTRENLRYPILHNGTEILPKKQWLWSKERVLKAQSENKLVFNYNQKEGTYTVRFKGYLYDEEGNEKLGKPTSIFVGPYTQEGTRDFQEIFDRDIMPFPKPVALIKQLLKINIGEKEDINNNIILDFFAGSGTTAQAVLELNEEDGGNRKFILVQMQDKKELNEDAKKAGYNSIFDITKARVTKVIEKINKGKEGTLAFDTDKKPLGFRTFRLADSNFKQWNTNLDSAENIGKQLELHVDSLTESALVENMLYELLLKQGLPLTTTVQTMKAEEGDFYYVAEASLCLALASYGQDTQNKIIGLKPKKVIILDRLFSQDDVISNAKNSFQALEIELIVL